jgi:hypothetical protein
MLPLSIYIGIVGSGEVSWVSSTRVRLLKHSVLYRVEVSRHSGRESTTLFPVTHNQVSFLARDRSTVVVSRPVGQACKHRKGACSHSLTLLLLEPFAEA